MHEQPSAATVLVVDDDPVIVTLLRVNFELEGWTVLSAANGEEGLALARAQHPDVVVCDVMMPRLDGLAVARTLRDDPATEQIPVLLLSAKAQGSDITAGLAVADDYMTKPFEPLELLDRVGRLATGASR